MIKANIFHLCLDQPNIPNVEDNEFSIAVPSVNKNQTGWHWFGGITSRNPEPKLAMTEALNSLISKCNYFILVTLKFNKKLYQTCKLFLKSEKSNEFEKNMPTLASFRQVLSVGFFYRSSQRR